jgi:hypothetical protein
MNQFEEIRIIAGHLGPFDAFEDTILGLQIHHYSEDAETGDLVDGGRETLEAFKLRTGLVL